MAPREIPAGLEARAERWRGRLADKKVLLVLDDAAGHAQVRPLLPGTAGCLVLVTSRRRLIALLAGRLAHHPNWNITTFTRDFADARDGGYNLNTLQVFTVTESGIIRNTVF